MDLISVILLILLVAALAVLAWTWAQRGAQLQQLASADGLKAKLEAEVAQLRTGVADRDAQVAAARASIAVLQSQLDSANKQLADAAKQAQELNDKITVLTGYNESYKTQLTKIAEEKERLQREAQLQFSELASKILDDKTQKSDMRLSEILAPLKDQIEKLKREITERSEKALENHASLNKQLEQLRDLNSQIGRDATNLANALKGNTRVQGSWGEQVLEHILESSGLEKGTHFIVQATRDQAGNTLVNDEGGRLRPDVIVHLPEGRDIIIDSKTSFTAYMEAVNATDEATQQEKMKEHAASVKKHVDELASKSYQDYVAKAGDFVMMFIPNEGAYLAAMHHDTALWEYAYNRRVVIISPTHLISVLKLVAQLWSHDKQTKNAIRIAEEAGKLYDRFVDFTDSMAAIEKGLNNAQQAYEKAMNKLREDGRGSILKQVKLLEDLGAKTKKKLQIEQ